MTPKRAIGLVLAVPTLPLSLIGHGLMLPVAALDVWMIKPERSSLARGLSWLAYWPLAVVGLVGLVLNVPFVLLSSWMQDETFRPFQMMRKGLAFVVDAFRNPLAA